MVTALKQNQVDAIVADLPTAFYITAAQVPGSKIVGQFSAPGGDSFGLLLEKDSKLTPCVDKALDELESSGELKQITRQVDGRGRGRAGAALTDRRAVREAARRRRAARGAAISAALDGHRARRLLATLILTSKGWPNVRDTFFDWDAFKDSFPDVLDGFWLDVKIFVIVEVGVLILGLVVALTRSTRNAAFFPFRMLAATYTDIFRGVPGDPGRLPDRVRRAGARAHRACPQTRWCSAAIALGALLRRLRGGGVPRGHRLDPSGPDLGGALARAHARAGHALRGAPAGRPARDPAAPQRLHRAPEGRGARVDPRARSRRSAWPRSRRPRRSTTRRCSRPRSSTWP